MNPKKLAVLSLAVFFLFSGTLYSFNSYALSSFGSNPPTNISGTNTTAKPASLASFGSDAYVTWAHSTTSNGIQMFLRPITNNGANLGTTVSISKNLAGTNDFQRVTASGNHVYVTWEVDKSSGESVMFRASGDNGVTWGSIQNLSKLAGTEVTCKGLCAQPTIAANGTNVYVAWAQQAVKGGTGSEIYFVASSDNGASFGTHFALTTIKGSHEQEMASWGNNVYLTWDTGATTYFAVSHNNGASFSAAQSLGTSTGRARESHLAAWGTHVYLVWEDNSVGKYQAFIRTSSDSGDSFGAVIDLSKGTNGGSWLPQITASGSDVYVAWGVLSGAGIFQLYFSYSHDSGSTFSKATNLSNDAGNAKNAVLDSNGNLVVVMWLDTSIDSGGQATTAISTNGGVTFGSPIQMDGGKGKYIEQQNDMPELGINGNVIFAAWTDTASSSGKAEVFFNSGLA
jgi:hypothetical protein